MQVYKHGLHAADTALDVQASRLPIAVPGLWLLGRMRLAGTSLPEANTVLAAVRMRRYDLAMGDIFGTNLFNVTIVVVVDALHAVWWCSTDCAILV